MAALPDAVWSAYRAAARAGDPRHGHGEAVSARRCWHCSVDDVGLDGWAVVEGTAERRVCLDCVRAFLGDGLPYVRVAAAYRGRAGSPRRALGEVYQGLVTFKEGRPGWAELAPWLARGLAASVRRVVSETPSRGARWVVVPVPSFRGRRPHVRVLTALAGLELPAGFAVRLDLLVKRVDMVQKGLTRWERRRESAGAYAVSRWRGRGVRGASVIVTDDFVTTGVTMAECARVLRAAGAAAVYGAAVVRVVLAPGERLVWDGRRHVRVQLRELDARGRIVVGEGSGGAGGGGGVLWVRFACGAACAVVHMAGPLPLPVFDRLSVHRWECQCGAAHDVRLRREWLGGGRECVAVTVAGRGAPELLVAFAPRSWAGGGAAQRLEQ